MGPSRTARVVAGIAALWIVVASHAAEARLRWGLSAELGPELDTNATRLQRFSGDTTEPVASGLLRLVARGNLKLNLGRRQLLSAAYGGGAKVFWNEDARPADELVHHADLGWAVRLRRGLLLLGGNYYDGFQRESVRDLRIGTGTLQLLLGHRPSGLSVGVNAGYRGLEYKPDSDMSEAQCVEQDNPLCAKYSFHGPQGGLGLRWALTSGRGYALVDWTLGLSYQAAYRDYAGLLRGLRERCSEADLGVVCSYFKDASRQDLHHMVRLQADYLGNADASLWYLAEINRSNSYGETYQRHVVGLRFTTSLVWGIYFTGKGVLQISRYADRYFINPVSSLSFTNIDEENRSSLMVQLARDLAEHWSVNLRYSLFVSEATSRPESLGQSASPSFLRQTFFLGIRFEYERR